MSVKVTEIRHGRYTIKTWPDGAGYSGRATLANVPLLDQAWGETASAVATTLRHSLDLRRAKMANGRGPEDTPTAEEFAEALLVVNSRMTDEQTRMLRALHDADERTLTATQLAEAAGKPSFEYANSVFGRLARMVAEEVGYSPSKRPDRTVRWTTTLALAADKGSDEATGHFRWTMRTEVAEALAGIARIVLLPSMASANPKST